jgi:hypothetical protein
LYRKAQEERILLLKHALEAKMGFDPTNSHYGLTENRAIITETTTSGVNDVPNGEVDNPAFAAAVDSTPQLDESVDDGMYL